MDWIKYMKVTSRRTGIQAAWTEFVFLSRLFGTQRWTSHINFLCLTSTLVKIEWLFCPKLAYLRLHVLYGRDCLHFSTATCAIGLTFQLKPLDFRLQGKNIFINKNEQEQLCIPDIKHINSLLLPCPNTHVCHLQKWQGRKTLWMWSLSCDNPKIIWRTTRPVIQAYSQIF